MSLASEEDIQDFVDEVRDSFGDRISEIMLFGSYARDDYVPGSDIDILVLLNDEARKEDRDRAGELTGKYFEEKGLFFSPKLMNAEEFQEKKEEGYSFHQEVAEQGVKM
ncbi:MAG: nucleotidyltransferase domain-containing protein [Candidatus Nanohaloarchaea archaeon]